MSSSKKTNGNLYDCAKCPGYCCSYPLIEVGKRDIQRLAKHFDISYAQAETRYTRFDKAEKTRSLRQQEDERRHHGAEHRRLSPAGQQLPLGR